MKYLRGKRRLVTKPATAALVLLLTLGAGAPIVGCASDQVSHDAEDIGSLGLKLEVAPGVTLLSVSYAVTGNGFSKTGTIDVGDSPIISGTIGGIPAGNGYTLELSATSAEDETVFSGSANFNVAAGQTTSVTIHLTGTSGNGTGGGKGSVSVNGTINVGPVIDDFTVTPLTVFVDGEVTLTAIANDVDSGPSPLAYAWSTSEGVIDGPAEATATITSATPGTVTITLTVTDGELTSTRTSTVTFVDTEEDEGTGGGNSSGGETSSGGAPGTGGDLGSGGTGSEQQGPLTLVTTAVAPNTAGVTTTVVPVPDGVEPGDIAVVFVLSTGSAPVVGSPEGFVTTALAAAQHNLSYGPVGGQTSLTWTSSATATTGATAFFFRGASVAVDVLSTSQPSGNTLGLAASTQVPQASFASGYALFSIQLGASGTPTVTTGPAAPWVGPATDGKQLLTWGQPYVPGADGFLFPSSLGGTLSASGVKRQAQVFVSSPAE